MVKWTEDQLSAIERGGHNIIVSAAAGSGKTAALVERIARSLNAGADIDSMLIVTFTNAAAAEMKEKIIRSLQASDMDYARKQRQLRLISGADICTIDSFCLKCVKNHTHDLNISPDFKLCEPAEDSLICDEAAQTLLDALYGGLYEDEISREDFMRMTEKYSSVNSDDNLKALILDIYGFIQSFAQPEEWLLEAAAEYGRDPLSGKWAAHAMKNQRDAAKYALDAVGRFAAMLCFECGIKTADSEEALRIIRSGYEDTDSVIFRAWGVLACEISGFAELARRTAKMSAEPSEESWNAAHALYNEAALRSYCPYSLNKDRKMKTLHGDWSRLRDSYVKGIYEVFVGECVRSGVSQTADEVREQIADTARDMRVIEKMVRLLSDTVAQIKLKRSVYSFSDIEHFARELFCDKTTAEEYRRKYREILIDEYQDTNGLQDDIFRRISEGDGSGERVPIFMVGDLKQSIYAFRGGDPEIFKEKSVSYENGGGGERIIMSKNFRSSYKILDGVNELFETVMSDENGDVDYKGRERLFAGREDFSKELPLPETALLPLFKETASEDAEREELRKERAEARYVAARIRRMIDSGETVGESDGKGARPMRYGDITVLSSALAGISDIYKEEFARKNIPLNVQGEGYFSLREICTMLSLIKVLINRRQDIPLASLMRSPIGGFSDEEIAKIRLLAPEGSISDALKAAAENTDGGELCARARKFTGMLDRWERYMHYKPVASLILDIYSETGFYNFLGALDGGEQAQANLRLFYERAKKYEESGFKGLFRFVKYIERLEAADAKTDGASLISENHNVVRMMTIHKSKGLEFPVVFLVSAGRSFRKTGGGEWSIGKRAGIGLRYINASERCAVPTIAQTYVEDEIRRLERCEDLRKLYVALTRPKERLIVTAARNYRNADALEEECGKWKSDFEYGRENPGFYGGAEGFYDWIMPLMLSGAEKWSFHIEDMTGMYEADIYSILTYRYPYRALSALPSKTTVTAIKARISFEEGEYDAYRESGAAASEPEEHAAAVVSMRPRPNCLETPRRAANLIGTAYHQIMAYMEPAENMDADYIRAQAERLCADGQVEPEDLEYIDAEAILGFFKDKSGIGGEFIRAFGEGRLHRESPFEIAVSPSVYAPELEAGESGDPDDLILLQGTIDCWIEYGDGSVMIIDYKTDRKRASETRESFIEEKRREYAVQLELYAEAVRRLGMDVRAKYLYLFSVQTAAEV